MTELLMAKQLRLHRAIGRSLENYKKLGKINLTAPKIRSRIGLLKDTWTQYQDNHDDLERAVPMASRATLDYFKDGYYDQAEEVYCAMTDHMNEDLEALAPTIGQAKSIEGGHARPDPSAISLSHLPPIRLPPFDGTYAEWETFRDRFTALILLNKDLSDFARMHFLVSALTGRALECIGNLAVAADNFSVAWQTLSARFENKRRLIASHLSTLLGLSAVTRESASELQFLCDKVHIAIASLTNLGRTPSELWNDVVVHILTNKLDPATRKAWNLKTSDADTPSKYEDLHRFVSSRVRALEDSAPASAAKPSPSSAARSPSRFATASRVHIATASASVPSACPLCKSRHYFRDCPEFIAQTPTQRRETVRKFKRCFNCLSWAHSVNACKSKFTCRSCHQRHHSLLHAESDAGTSPSAAPLPASRAPQPVAPKVEVNSLLASAKSDVRSQVLLATAWVRVRVVSGRTVTVRALLDQGSEATFMSEHLAQTLRSKRIRMPISISAVGGTHVGTVRHAAEISVSPRDSDTPSVSTTALILASLTSYTPRHVSDLSHLSHLSDLLWADADPTSSDPIHLIVGADIYGEFVREGVRQGMRGQPVAQNSVFGWIISGPLAPEPDPSRSATDESSVERIHARFTVHHCAQAPSLDEEIRRFWEIEELPHSTALTPHEEQCENHFRATHSRLSDGRYMVRLPFKQSPPIDIGRSRLSAERVFTALSRRLQSNSGLATEYDAFMREYEALGHMRRMPEGQHSSAQCVYIPHHAVFREGSATTHLRVVFNASSITSNGSSLNDALLASPKLQADLAAILLQWRHFKYVYTADIAKMYRQIMIDPQDRDYQRILWTHDRAEAPGDYQLLTVTYGMTCAPFLALRVIKRLIEDDGHHFPLAIPILADQIYVDDVLFGGDDVAAVKQSRDHLVALLRRGKFELRKWASNSAALLDDIDPTDHGLACDKHIAADEKLKILGIVWNPARDAFQFKVATGDSVPSSKRAILSAIVRLYDPLGWVTPVTVTAKVFMQQLWRIRIQWDDLIPEPLLNKWQLIYSKLLRLDELRLGRWTGVHTDVSHLELHGFADASTVAYAAAVYLKVVSASGDVTISLLAGKSKVAPLIPLTVPRLELSAALLLVRLLNFVRASTSLKTVPCVCWTDSMIVLSWLRSHPSRWKTFVANRVAAIVSNLPDAEWRHVPTADNPADCASRGLLGDELLEHALWWQGPSWLQRSKETWPQEPAPSPLEAHLEEKIVALHAAEPPDRWDLDSRFSSWPKLIRVTAYLLRFINACRRLRDEKSDAFKNKALSAEECHRARTFWIKRIQAELFPRELHPLTRGQPVASTSSVVALRPFLDRDGVIRVGGRLRHAPLPYRVRHPILLASHPLVHRIIEQAHFRALHGGPQLTLSTLRQDFWLLRARSLVKAAIYKCVACVRERATLPEQLMGDLPQMRISPSRRSFVHCGLDYAGPVKIRASAGRGIASRKAYVALFVCLATRAIHLEVVSDYSTPAFLNAYNRFCSRRGLPTAIYSDNGTTFVGADKELRVAYQSALRDPDFLNKTATDNVAWKFIPPSAPHFGGMWEAGVRSVKHHLRRLLGDHTLSFEEFTTLLCQIEACLNSHPIAPLSDSLDDYECLTPGHFLIGSALTVAPEPSLLHINENRLSRWQVVRHLTERFWKLWATEYVNTLQQRSKWRGIRSPIKIGQLVLMRNATLPPCKWELGRITHLHSGPDGLTRVVTVKTATSEYKRPIVKLCVIPVTSESANE